MSVAPFLENLSVSFDMMASTMDDMMEDALEGWWGVYGGLEEMIEEHMWEDLGSWRENSEEVWRSIFRTQVNYIVSSVEMCFRVLEWDRGVLTKGQRTELKNFLEEMQQTITRSNSGSAPSLQELGLK